MTQNPDVSLFMRSMQGGGAERVMANIANGLAQAGLIVDLILINATGQHLDDLRPEVTVTDLDVKARDRLGPLRLPTGFQSLGCLVQLVDYLKSRRPRILLCATHYLNEVAIAAKRLARVNTRVIVSEHTTLSVEAAKATPRSAKLIPYTARLLYPLADDIVAVSAGVAADLARSAKLDPQTIQVIYNPAIPQRLFRQAQAAVYHPWFEEAPRIPIVVGSGRFVNQKDFSTLVRAFAQVRQRQPVRLMLLGDGGERAKLQSLAEQLGVATDVWFPGFVDNPYAYMAKATVFAASSVWEGLPTVLIEAMALGLPIVSTDCPSGPAEILQGGRYGDLVPVGDASALAGAIANVLQGDRKQVPQSHIEQFTAKAAIACYLALFERHRVYALQAQPLAVKH